MRKPESGADGALAPDPVHFPTIVCSLPSPGLRTVPGEPGLKAVVLCSLVTSLVNDVNVLVTGPDRWTAQSAHRSYFRGEFTLCDSQGGRWFVRRGSAGRIYAAPFPLPSPPRGTGTATAG